MLEADAGGLAVQVEPSHQPALSSNSRMAPILLCLLNDVGGRCWWSDSRG
jgi:hypothetical protein